MDTSISKWTIECLVACALQLGKAISSVYCELKTLLLGKNSIPLRNKHLFDRSKCKSSGQSVTDSLQHAYKTSERKPQEHPNENYQHVQNAEDGLPIGISLNSYINSRFAVRLKCALVVSLLTSVVQFVSESSHCTLSVRIHALLLSVEFCITTSVMKFSRNIDVKQRCYALLEMASGQESCL